MLLRREGEMIRERERRVQQRRQEGKEEGSMQRGGDEGK